MRLIDLLATIDTDVESDEKVQICHPGRNWEDYDEFSAGSKLLKPFYDLKVKSLSAINTDVIRVDLDFDEKGGEADKIDFNEVFVGASEFAQDTRNAAQMLIDNQPTAFDLDKVMEQLENRSALARPVGWSKAYEIIMLKDAIEIVKGGGVE